MNAEVRRMEYEVGETGVGQANRTDVTWELGAEIDGAWVRFSSVPGSTVEALVQRARDTAASTPAPQATEASGETATQQGAPTETQAV
jgi:ribosomal protein L12E/L44/L45/RPP1/RPP2